MTQEDNLDSWFVERATSQRSTYSSWQGQKTVRMTGNNGKVAGLGGHRLRSHYGKWRLEQMFAFSDPPPVVLFKAAWAL